MIYFDEVIIRSISGDPSICIVSYDIQEYLVKRLKKKMISRKVLETLVEKMRVSLLLGDNKEQFDLSKSDCEYYINLIEHFLSKAIGNHFTLQQ